MSGARPLDEAVDACPPVVRLYLRGPKGASEAQDKRNRQAAARCHVNLEDDTRAAEIGELAAALIERYAPGAPGAAKDEAVIEIRRLPMRNRSSYGAIRKGRRQAPLSVEYITNHSGHVSELRGGGDSHSLENQTGGGYRMSARIPAIDWRGGALRKARNDSLSRTRSLSGQCVSSSRGFYVPDPIRAQTWALECAAALYARERSPPRKSHGPPIRKKSRRL